MPLKLLPLFFKIKRTKKSVSTVDLPIQSPLKEYWNRNFWG